MQPFPAEPDETTNILTDPAYRANNDPPGCSISLVIQGRGRRSAVISSLTLA